MTMGDQMRQRYPRLLRSVQRVHGLSEAAALTVLVEYAIFGITDDTIETHLASLGGPLVILRHGISRRHCHPTDR
ncbi:MAG: hypothetical protein IPM20_12365 [Gammaproteobacteria bacterium]|nr:hypothetical protein [Gammaproteobacteria bacterium]